MGIKEKTPNDQFRVFGSVREAPRGIVWTKEKHQTERDLIFETLHNMLCFVKHLLLHLVLEKIQRIFVRLFCFCQYITFLRLILVSVSFKRDLSVFW